MNIKSSIDRGCSFQNQSIKPSSYFLLSPLIPWSRGSQMPAPAGPEARWSSPLPPPPLRQSVGIPPRCLIAGEEGVGLSQPAGGQMELFLSQKGQKPSCPVLALRVNSFIHSLSESRNRLICILVLVFFGRCKKGGGKEEKSQQCLFLLL